jgi:RHS repeat-associated protein
MPRPLRIRPLWRAVAGDRPGCHPEPLPLLDQAHRPTTDLVLYEYRAYSPTLGRWLSRDLIGEVGGRNLYGFVVNVPTSKADLLGFGCWVTFECQLYSETTQGKCDKHCDYVCVEKDRVTVKGLSLVTCDDMPQQKITITHGITAWGSFFVEDYRGQMRQKGRLPFSDTDIQNV